MTTFSPGDKVLARYGALLDDDGEPMVAEVLREHPDPADDGVLIRYRCPDGSATDNWVKAGDLAIVPEDILYIRPGARGSAVPVIDTLTRKMTAEYRAAESNGVLWRGFRTCRCGARSTNTDYILPGGATTNSLCIHYLAFHRDEVPPNELVKVAALTSGEAEPNIEELAAPSQPSRSRREP